MMTPGEIMSCHVKSAKKILGQVPFYAMDIGAAEGLLPHWKNIEQFAHLYLVEPNKTACAKLKKLFERHLENIKIIETGLSKNTSEVTLYQTATLTGSSLLEPFDHPYINQDYFFPISKEKIFVQCGRDMFHNEKLESPSLLKLDVQGTELDVLEGFDVSNLKKTIGIELEIGMPGGYKNQTKFCDVDIWMKDHGFELFDMRPTKVYRTNGLRSGELQKKWFNVIEKSPTLSAKIWEIDAVYFKNPSLLKNNEELLCLVIGYCIYGFFLEAFSLIQEMKNQKNIPLKSLNECEQAIKEWHDSRRYAVFYRDHYILKKIRSFFSKLSPKDAHRWDQYMEYEYPSG